LRKLAWSSGPAIAAALTLAACSFATVRRPPEAWTPGEPLECTSSKEAPSTDFTVAGLLLVPSVSYFLVAGPICRVAICSSGVEAGAYVALGLVAASIPFVVSGAFGTGWVKECRRLECVSGVEESCEKPKAVPPPPPATKPPESLPSGAGEGNSPE
jgi:hypothetical protein